MEKTNKNITSRDVDFAKWYNDIISEADQLIIHQSKAV